MKTVEELINEHLPKRYYGHEARKYAKKAMQEYAEQYKQDNAERKYTEMEILNALHSVELLYNKKYSALWRDIKTSLNKKGKHIGYIYPFETIRDKKVLDKIAIKDGNYLYKVVDIDGIQHLIQAEIAQSWEKYYEPVEEPITICGKDVEFSNGKVFIDGNYWDEMDLRNFLKWTKSGPNLAEKLQQIINKMESK